MAQNEGSEGFMGTVRNYIPGLSSSSSPSNEAQTSSASQQGILSYIPGFASGPTDQKNAHEGKANTATQGAHDTGEVTSPHKSNVQGAGTGSTEGVKSQEPTTGGLSGDNDNTPKQASDYSSSYQGAGIGTKYSSGRHDPSKVPTESLEKSHESKQADTPTSAAKGTDTPSKAADAHQKTLSQGQKAGNNDSLAHTQGFSQGSQGYSNQRQAGRDDGVRGAPIEGEDVKGYAVSAPVGSGDTNIRSVNGDPSGQVSGAHMQYAPEDTDTRDHTGRGTVGRTKGEGDSSFANVKRNIPHGTEHVVTKSSQSHIEHTSTTHL